MAEAEKDDWLDALDSPDDKTSTLDQSDLDSLLFDAGGQGQQGASAASIIEDELDQSAIDALLSGSDDTFSAPTPKNSSNEDIDLGQADIDELLASPQKPGKDQGVTDPDQDEIDKLFSDVDSGGAVEENPFLAEEIEFKDVLTSPDAPDQSVNLDFDAEEFKLDADIPDIPDTTDSLNFDQQSPSIAKDPVATSSIDEPTAKISPESEKNETTKGLERLGFAAKLHQLLANRKILLGVGGSLAVALLIGAGVFFMKGRGPNTAVAPSQAPHDAQVAAQQPAPAIQHTAPPPPPDPPQLKVVPPHNTPPLVENLELTMPAESEQLVVTLSGKDQENDHLEYEFVSMPAHGQISGHAPNLIYTPKPDFSGQDSFSVKATDGKEVSPPASVTITRQAQVIVKETAPVKPEIAKEGPPTEVAAKVETPVEDKPITTAESPPPHDAAGVKNKSYPLISSKGTTSSKKKTVAVTGKHKNKAPVLRLQPMASIYTTGDTVIINASQTGDENRASLIFKWEQVAGVPVLIKPLNSDESQIAFVAPSYFNTVTNPSVQIKVTATDQEGASDSKEITISTKSRRSSAIWQGK